MPLWQVCQGAHVANSFGIQLIIPLSLPFPPLQFFLLLSSALSLSALEITRSLCTQLLLLIDLFFGGPELESASHDCDHTNEEWGFAQAVKFGIFFFLFAAGWFPCASAAWW
jgi:hypothetical protein